MLPRNTIRTSSGNVDKEELVKIYASSDHAGFALRKVLVSALRQRGIEVEDRGPADATTPRDYPAQAEEVARQVSGDEGARGLLVCGSGIGMCMAANRVRGARAVDAWNVEAARLSRAHNDANVLCLGARLLSEDDALAILDTWLATPFEAGRHALRVAQLDAFAEAVPRAQPRFPRHSPD